MDGIAPPDKDCQNCRRRRIKCDRGLPHCHKCSKKGLVCGGYVKQIRWAGGAAVRGRLREFKSHPATTVAPSFETLERPAPHTQLQIRHSPLSSHVPTHTHGMQATILETISTESMKQLVDYYEHNIAALMVWIDSPNNAYRRYVVPLAHKNPVVGLAVAAVAAQHAATVISDTSFPEKARNEAVERITHHIHDITSRIMEGQDLEGSLDPNGTEWLLASMLILGLYEMTHSGAVAAEFHRKAARSLVNTVNTVYHKDRELFSFLRNQLAIDDVLCCTASFKLSSTEDAIVPDPEEENILFARYLKILHDVTVLSRHTVVVATGGVERLGLDFTRIRQEFAIARSDTLMTAGRLSLKPASYRHDFSRVVEIYYHAALLYSGRCLQCTTADQMETITAELFSQIMSVEHIYAWVHHLIWPLFIAGVESHRDEMRQKVVIDLYYMTAEKMKFRHYDELIEFLHTFWAGEQADWRVLAQSWEEMGRLVLPQ